MIRPQSDIARPTPRPANPFFADWSVNDSSRPEALKQTLATLYAPDIRRPLRHQKNIRVPLEFFRERFIDA